MSKNKKGHGTVFYIGVVSVVLALICALIVVFSGRSDYGMAWNVAFIFAGFLSCAVAFLIILMCFYAVFLLIKIIICAVFGIKKDEPEQNEANLAGNRAVGSNSSENITMARDIIDYVYLRNKIRNKPMTFGAVTTLIIGVAAAVLIEIYTDGQGYGVWTFILSFIPVWFILSFIWYFIFNSRPKKEVYLKNPYDITYLIREQREQYKNAEASGLDGSSDFIKNEILDGLENRSDTASSESSASVPLEMGTTAKVGRQPFPIKVKYVNLPLFGNEKVIYAVPTAMSYYIKKFKGYETQVRLRPGMNAESFNGRVVRGKAKPIIESVKKMKYGDLVITNKRVMFVEGGQAITLEVSIDRVRIGRPSGEDDALNINFGAEWRDFIVPKPNCQYAYDAILYAIAGTNVF